MADQELTGLIVKIRADLSDYVLKLAQMDRQTDTTSGKVSASLAKISTAAAGMAAGVTAAAAIAVRSAIEWGKAVDDLSDKTGMAGQESSKFLIIAKRTGMDMQTAQTMWMRFGKSVFEATDSMVKATAAGKQSDDVLTMLGVTALDASGNMRPAVDIFKDIRDRLNQMPDGLQKTAIEMKLFGRSGAEMHDILHMSNEEMQAAIGKAEALGLIIDSKTAKAMEKFDRDINSAKGSLTAFGMGIATEVMPKLQVLLDGVNSGVKWFVQWKDSAGPLAKGLSDVAESILLVAAACKALSVAGLSVPKWLIPAGMSAAGVGAAATGVLAVGYMGSKIGQSDAAKGLAETEAGTWGVQTPSSDSLEKYLQAEMAGGAFTKPKASAGAADTFLGGSGAGGGGSAKAAKTEMQEYLESMNKILQVEEQRYKLTGDADAYKAALLGQYEGLRKVAVGDDEVIEKEVALNNLTLKGIDLVNDEARAAQQATDAINKSLEERRKASEKVFEEQVKQIEKLVNDQIDAAKKTQNAWQDVFVGLLSGDGVGNLGKTLQREAATYLVKGSSSLFGSRKKTTTKVDGLSDEQNEALQGFISTIGVGTNVMTILNGITSILGMTTKPAESAATLSATAAKATEIGAMTLSVTALDALALSAEAAAAALASIEMIGLAGLHGGVVPSAAGGYITPYALGGIPAVLHAREMVLPRNISEMLIKVAQTGSVGGGGQQYININVNNAQNLDTNQLVTKLGRRIQNMRRGI